MTDNLTKSIELLKVQVTNAVKTLEVIDKQISAEKAPLTIPPFGENIKALRRQHNLTQLELCSVLDITQYALSGYERDIITPDVETVLKMAKYFGITVDELLKSREAQ